MPVISIIIPVYKVQQYLRRCLDSVLAQTFTDYECILVDDGSPDNCPVICDEYVEKDKRFKVIHKKQNEGLPKARKSGLDIAITEFIMHLDSDDWIEPDALELLFRKQQESDADIVMGGIRDIYSYGKTLYYHPELKPDMKPLVYFFLYRCRNMIGKLYKKKLFDNIIIPDVNMGEDAIINVQLFAEINNEKLQRINSIIYNYDHASGMTSRYKYNYMSYIEAPVIKCRLWIEKFLEGIQFDNEIQTSFYYYMISEGIGNYLRFNKNINKQEVSILFEKYYKPVMYRYMYNQKFKLYRSLLFLFHYSIFLGKMYRCILNIIIPFKNKLKVYS